MSLIEESLQADNEFARRAAVMTSRDQPPYPGINKSYSTLFFVGIPIEFMVIMGVCLFPFFFTLYEGNSK